MAITSTRDESGIVTAFDAAGQSIEAAGRYLLIAVNTTAGTAVGASVMPQVFMGGAWHDLLAAALTKDEYARLALSDITLGKAALRKKFRINCTALTSGVVSVYWDTGT